MDTSALQDGFKLLGRSGDQFFLGRRLSFVSIVGQCAATVACVALAGRLCICVPRLDLFVIRVVDLNVDVVDEDGDFVRCDLLIELVRSLSFLDSRLLRRLLVIVEQGFDDHIPVLAIKRSGLLQLLLLRTPELHFVLLLRFAVLGAVCVLHGLDHARAAASPHRILRRLHGRQLLNRGVGQYYGHQISTFVMTYRLLLVWLNNLSRA